MKKTLLIVSSFLFAAIACKKQVTPVCEPCNVTGIYSGIFHDVGGCYTCVPYTDTTYTGSFVVNTLATDSIIIIRSYDNYEWRFAYNDTGKYNLWACCTVGESFEFKLPDSLTYYYNNGGGGGYFRQEFAGKKQ